MKRVKRNCTDSKTQSASYNEYKQFLMARGYAENSIDSAIEQADKVPRDRLLGITEMPSNEKTSIRKYPLIIKFNPKLPPMSKFIHKHLHILDLTPETAKMFNKQSIFVSYKMEQNILSMITKNKFKTSQASASQDSSNGDQDWGCFGCGKSCALCKNFLVVGKTFTSPKTNQTYQIKSRITCDTCGVIYLILDKKCLEIFYVGYTVYAMKDRWPNHKSHIKVGKKSCEIATHFKTLSNNVHKLDKSNQLVYTSELREHLSVQIIEHVVPIPGRDYKSLLQERENFWQGALKATKLYGGINKRSNKI